MHQPIRHQKVVLHSIGLLLVACLAFVGLRSIAVRSGTWNSSVSLQVRFDVVEGLRSGDPVRLQGMRAGHVTSLEPPAMPGSPIVAHLAIDPVFARLLRQDTTAVITTQGLIGQPVVELQPGSADAPPVDPKVPLQGRSAASIAQLTEQAARNLAKLERLTEQAQTGLAQINQVSSAIARGEGSLGKLVTSDDAYRKMMRLGSRGEETLEDLQQNLESLKQSWLFSRMFQQRGYLDEKTLLYDPQADQFHHSLETALLFEPNSAILTAVGRQKLDEAVRLIRSALLPNSELVIAAFSEPGSNDEKLMRKLTQSQAEAVRDYLENAHSVSYVGLFQWRKVTAVGYGSTRPLNWDQEKSIGNRLDFIVMTPRSGQARR